MGKEGKGTPFPHPSKELIKMCSEKVAKKPMKIRQHNQKSIKKNLFGGGKGAKSFKVQGYN